MFGEVLVNADSAAEVLLAQARLALAADNMNAAMVAAQRALAIDANLIEAQAIVLRALSMLGEHNAAIAGARALDASQLQGDDAFLLADLLTAAEPHAGCAGRIAAPRRAGRNPPGCRAAVDLDGNP